MAITNIEETAAGMVLRFASVLGRSYALQRSDAWPATQWRDVATHLQGTGGMLEVTEPNSPPSPNCFYRFVVAW
jgi:hypothetical protein